MSLWKYVMSCLQRTYYPVLKRKFRLLLENLQCQHIHNEIFRPFFGISSFPKDEPSRRPSRRTSKITKLNTWTTTSNWLITQLKYDILVVYDVLCTIWDCAYLFRRTLFAHTNTVFTSWAILIKILIVLLNDFWQSNRSWNGSGDPSCLSRILWYRYIEPR